MKLTAKAVATLTLPEGKSDLIYFDDDLSGFGYRLRRSPSGKVNATWVCQYRNAGATRRILLGAGSVLSAEQARMAAKKILAQVALGEDPQSAKADRRAKDRQSMRVIIDEYLAIKAAEIRPGSLRETQRYLCGPYFKALHGMPIDSIARRDVAAAVIATQRKHGSNVAALARVTLSGFFSWCVQMGLIEVNPVIGSPTPKTNEARDRVLSDDELVRIWNACQDDDHGKIIKLLILTACRREEIGGMTWDEIAGASWTLPKERSKNGKAHTLPLMPAMLDIIKTVPRMASRDHLFGERSPSGFCRWGQGKAALDARSGVTGWQVRDIRRSVDTKMADIGVMPHIIEQILNHQSGHKRGDAGTYNRSVYEREVRAALALWHDHVRTLVDGGERVVVPFVAS